MIPDDEMITLAGLKEGHRVLELGNKQKDGWPYRKWYVEHGVDYACLDWNARNGAIPLDMRYSIDPKTDFDPPGPFDYVTNFGFTEHVTSQDTCWQNVYRFMKVGGCLALCMPFPFHLDPKYKDRSDSWEYHGYYQPTFAWYEEFIERNGMEVDFLKVNDKRVRPTIIGRLIKTNDELAVMPNWSLMHRTRRAFAHGD